MTQKIFLRLPPRRYGRFTLSGNPLSAPHRISTALGGIAALLLWVSATPADARPQIGPTSSADVNITLSVTPKFGLRSIGNSIPAAPSADARSDRFCVATNSSPTVLPVLMVWPSTEPARITPTEAQTAIPLTWCNFDGVNPGASIGAGEQVSGSIIIRPE